METNSQGNSLWISSLGAAAIGGWSWDLLSDTVEYSPEWKQMRGCADQNVGDSMGESLRRVHVDDREDLEAKRTGLVAGQSDSFSHDYRVQHADGSWIWVEERTSVIRDDGGTVVRLIGCEIDITQRKKEELKLDDGFNPALFDSLPVAISRIENRECVYVNEYWCQITGRSRESALGNGWMEAIHPDDREEIANRIEQQERGTPGEEVVVDGIAGRHLNPDGTINWFVAKLRLNYGMDGILASSLIVVLDVTERKQLERQQERLNEILEATTDFIGIASPDRKILWHNKRLASFRPDLKPEEDPDFSLAHPEWSRKIMAEVAIPAAIEHGCWSGKMAIFDQDGNEVPVSQVLIAHKGSDGSVEALSTIMRDTSEQEATERALRLSERNYANLAATAPVGIYRMSDPATCIYVNETWSKLTGISPEEALGTGWMKAVHPDDMKMFEEKAVTFVSDPNQMVLDGHEGRNVLPDGSTRWVQCHLAKELDDDGNVTGYIGTLTDIDRVKRAEEELKELNQRLHQVLEFSAIGIWDWFWEEKRLVWDEKMHEIYGVAPEDFRGERSDWTDRIHPDDRERIIAERKLLSESNKPFTSEYRIVRPSGEVRHIYASVYSEVSEHGIPVRTTGVNVDITDRREAEFALLETENKLQRISDNLPGLVYRYFLDSDGSHGFKYLSSQVRELFGFEPSELIANRELLWQFVDPDDSARLIEKMHDSAKDLSRHEEEFRITMPGRDTRWFQATSQPQEAENGSIVWDGVMLEITGRKTAEIELQDAKHQLERITENVPGMIYRHVFPKKGDEFVRYISPQSSEMYGIEPAKAIAEARAIWQQIHPEDQGPLSELVASSIESLEPLIAEYRASTPQGNRWHQVTGQPRRLENGDVTIDGVVQDVTDRKSAQLALEAAKLQMERITENVPGMIYQYVLRSDGTHTSTFASSQSHEMYELTPDEIMGDVDRLFNTFHPEDIGMAREVIEESARTLQPLKIEYRVLLPTKGMRWQQSIGHPTRTETGDTVWDGIVTDITHRKRAELQLRLANDELARATKLKDEFLANMSHELRTPLSAILGMVEGLQFGVFGSVTDKQKDSYEVIEQSATHLLSLINEVLDLAKIESGSVELDFTTVEIPGLCESSMQLVAQQAEKKNIHLNLSVPFNLPAIEADEKRIHQVLINLLSNAVKFTPDNGQITLDVKRLESHEQGREMIRISVTDTGIGIDDSKLETLFDPFIQVDSSLNRSYEGTGLGLALVRQFVELHSGHVRVTSELGVGSCFSVDLPLRQLGTRTTEPRDANSQSTSKGTTARDSSAFVLLAEDNELVAKTTKRFLEASNFRVQLVTDGQAAVDMARDKLPDVILMDVQMPGVDGLEAIRRLREMPALSETPVIALTGLAMPGDAKRCLAAGANLYLSKPYGMQELVEAIRGQMSQSSRS